MEERKIADDRHTLELRLQHEVDKIKVNNVFVAKFYIYRCLIDGSRHSVPLGNVRDKKFCAVLMLVNQ